MSKLARIALITSVIPGLVLAVSTSGAADPATCGPSAGSQLCLTAPADALSGEVTIAATWDGSGSATLEFTLDGHYLNFEYRDPYSFVWPTHKELDGVYTLAVRVHKGSTYGAYVSTQVTLDNGNLTSVPRSARDYAELFSPQPDRRTIAAVGNAGAEKPDEKQLLEYIVGIRPAAFLYLGEVHEFGSWATRRDHYGLASFDDAQNRGTLWGQMARYTMATSGNHERGYFTEFRDYWHQRPMWSSEVVTGVRIYNLISDCHLHGGCRADDPQGRWLSRQLATNTERCVLSFWHRPLVSMDAKRSGDRMLRTWAMLARNGGDLVLNADTREMEELRPMNASLETRKADSHMVELVSGAAAARWVRSNTSDSRVAWSRYQVPGAVFVKRERNTLTWQFRDFTGVVIRTGSVSC